MAIHSFIHPFVTECGGILHNPNGAIRSPNYPNSYNDDSDCVWIGELPEEGMVSLTITEFDLPASVNCSDDKLVIQNGKHSDSPIVASLCGNNSGLAHRTFTLSGAHFRVHLISNNKNGVASRRRFKIIYTTIKSGQYFTSFIMSTIC